MIEENVINNSGVFLPFFLKSYSIEGTLYLSRDHCSLETHSSFQELFNSKSLCFIDREKETHSKKNSETYNQIVALLTESEMEKDNHFYYKKLLECFLKVNQLTDSKDNRKDESIKALELQSLILEKMIKCIKQEIVK